MLDTNQVDIAKKAIAQCTKGGEGKIDHVSTEGADVFRFPSDSPESLIKNTIDALGRQFGCMVPVPLNHSQGKMPMGGDLWYEAQFVK